MSLSDKTVRSYLDILTETFMVRQLQPWFENLGKRQVKAPKTYFRDSGLLHTLLGLSDANVLAGHPSVGASWEGFVLEEILRIVKPSQPYFWAMHGGSEIDLFFEQRERHHAVQIKFNEAPKITRSMRIALEDLRLDHLWIVYPGEKAYQAEERISVWPLKDVSALPDRLH